MLSIGVWRYTYILTESYPSSLNHHISHHLCKVYHTHFLISRYQSSINNSILSIFHENQKCMLNHTQLKKLRLKKLWNLTYHNLRYQWTTGMDLNTSFKTALDTNFPQNWILSLFLTKIVKTSVLWILGIFREYRLDPPPSHALKQI